MNENFRVATIIGKKFKESARELTHEDWKFEKEYATITEKAIAFSSRSGKTLDETISIKVNEMKNGLILAKDHEFDDYARGFLAGWFLESDILDANTESILDEVEDIWDKKWFDVDVNKKDLYAEIIIAVKKKNKYKNMGMITLQELTRRCLAAMENGLGDKYVIKVGNVDNQMLLEGDFVTNQDYLRQVIGVQNQNVDVDDLVGVM